MELQSETHSRPRPLLSSSHEKLSEILPVVAALQIQKFCYVLLRVHVLPWFLLLFPDLPQVITSEDSCLLTVMPSCNFDLAKRSFTQHLCSVFDSSGLVWPARSLATMRRTCFQLQVCNVAHAACSQTRCKETRLCFACALHLSCRPIHTALSKQTHHVKKLPLRRNFIPN